MTAQVLDLVEAGVPSDVERVRDDVEWMRDQTRAARDDAVERTGRAVRLADDAALRAAASADKAAAWALRGAGIVIAPEPPGTPVPGQVWLSESSRPRTPLYPSASLHPGAGVYPQRQGREPDGARRVTGIHRWDEVHARWDSYTLGPETITQADSRGGTQ